MDLTKLRFIDALRGLAIFGVIVVHTHQYCRGLPTGVRELARSGARGVQLFYVVSAFTLFLSLWRRRGDERNPTANFFIRRFFRVAPLFWCAVVYYLLTEPAGQGGFMGSQTRITWGNILATVTFTNGWNPYWITSIVPGGWSVAVEMVFYLTVPLLFWSIRKPGAALWFTFAALLLSIAATRYALSHCPLPATGKDRRLWIDFLFFWLPSQLPVFGLGIAFFFSFRWLHANPAILAPENRRSRLSMAWVLLAICLYLAWALPKVPFPRQFPEHFAYGLAFLILATSLALYANPLLVNPFWTYLGKVSYSGYLVHWTVLHFVHRHLTATLADHGWRPSALPYFALLLPCATLAILIVSTVTYHLIEQPGQALGRRLIKRLERRAAPHPAAALEPLAASGPAAQ